MKKCFIEYIPSENAWVPIIAENNIPFKAIRIETKEQAQAAPSPCTSYAMFYNGEFLTNEQSNEVFFAGNYQMRIHSPIITTGNELVKQQIADFSKQLNLEELYSYIFQVRESTERILERLSYDELKIKIPEERKEYLKSLNVVNDNENAIWLIDYWCDKDVRSLIQMPFSRHWIMHIEACLRIKNKIHL